ncbi:MAG TPA: zinc ribbon domain-containing protein [Pyrinomonadaceae bacterium]|nr:zinc ribbon domain-containing protein [Pyrinomonadaceae bacterium]
MSEKDKPIFPRSSDVDNDEKEKLYKKTAQKLGEEEKSENIFQLCSQCWAENPGNSLFCLDCGKPLNSYYTALTNLEPVGEPPPRTMYGPPALMMKDKEIYVPRPAYGPPPISILNYRIWLILGALLLLVAFVLYFLIFR